MANSSNGMGGAFMYECRLSIVETWLCMVSKFITNVHVEVTVALFSATPEPKSIPWTSDMQLSALHRNFKSDNLLFI